MGSYEGELRGATCVGDGFPDAVATMASWDRPCLDRRRFGRRPDGVPPRKGQSFFALMAVALLVLTLVGFSPTYFLRPLTGRDPLPWRFHLHAVLNLTWLVLVVIQTQLVARKRTDLHRRIGLLGIAAAAGVVAGGLFILGAMVRRAELPGDMLRVSSTLWGNLGSLTSFSLLVTMGLLLRRRPEVHKRLMLVATLAIMGPPLVRIGHIDGLRVSESFVVNDAVWSLGGILILHGVLVIHDLRGRGRPHAVVVIGLLLYLAMTFGAGLGIASTEAGQGFIHWLR